MAAPAFVFTAVHSSYTGGQQAMEIYWTWNDSHAGFFRSAGRLSDKPLLFSNTPYINTLLNGPSAAAQTPRWYGEQTVRHNLRSWPSSWALPLLHSLFLTFYPALFLSPWFMHWGWMLLLPNNAVNREKLTLFHNLFANTTASSLHLDLEDLPCIPSVSACTLSNTEMESKLRRTPEIKVFHCRKNKWVLRCDEMLRWRIHPP